MRTTLELPDELFRQVKAKAALAGTSLKDLLTRYVVSGLDQPVRTGVAGHGRSQLPLIKRVGRRRVPNLSAERQARLEEADDLAKLRRFFGR
jgi:hypothetical protein